MLNTLRRRALSVCMAGLATVLLLLVFSTWARGNDSLGTASLNPATPTILGVRPDRVPNDLDTTIMVTGAGFRAELSGTLVLTGPTVYLDALALPTVAWVNSTTLTGTVPWGLDPGTYTVTVSNPDGGAGSLPGAFSVEQAIGVWTTGGPYGGQIFEMAVSPVTSQTAYAVASGAGLFRTTDGGDSWETLIADQGAKGVVYGPPPTDTLYYWGSGLQLSDDGGQTWQSLIDGRIEAFAYAPQDERQLWAADVGGEGLVYSEDGGTTWDGRNTGLPDDAWPAKLAVDPADLDIVYAGLNDGRLYKTTDRGQHWQLSSTGLSSPNFDHPAQALAVDPFAPDVLLYSRMHEYDVSVYRSTDGGANWSSIEIAPELGGGFVSDIAFSRQVSGTVHATMMGPPLIRSDDGGLTWTAVCTDVGDGIYSLGLEPLGEIPVYLGGWASGTYRSHDGGRSFERATEGIAALWPLDVATSAGHPETVYTAVDRPGAFKSDDLGHSWRLVHLPWNQALSVAVDPQDFRRAYVGSVTVFRTADGGETWDAAAMPVGSLMLFQVTVNPLSPTVIFAGGQVLGENNVWMDQNRGIVLRGSDYGASWSQLDLGQPISTVRSIAVDPTNSQRIYVGTAAGGRSEQWSLTPGVGLFRSLDNGETWEAMTKDLGHVAVSALAVHPENSQIVFAGVALSPGGPGRLYKSTDGGDSWSATSLQLNWGWVSDVAIDPLSPDTVYAGTDEGLFRSDDGGLTWSRVPDTLGQVQIWGLAVASKEQRTILYVSTLGGFPSGRASAWSPAIVADQDGFLQGGIYTRTILHRRVYIPIVLKE
jgi:photosystem II stability/assembly factor-like uncharacterized protein